ncbi:MAG: PKD domain-containing protein [Promethearchaeota archaeon]
MKRKKFFTKFFIILCLAITLIPTTSGFSHTQSVDCILVHNSQCGSCENRYNKEVTSFYEKYQSDERINFKIYDIANLEEQDSFLKEIDRLGIDLNVYGDLPYVIFIWDTNIQVLDATTLNTIDQNFQDILLNFTNISPSSPQNNSISLLDFLPDFNYPILYFTLVIIAIGIFVIHKGYSRYLKHGGSFIYPRRISPIRFWTLLALSSISISLLLYQFLERLVGGCGCASGGDIVQTLLFQKYDHIIILDYVIPIAAIGILFNLSVILQIILLGAVRFRQKRQIIVKILYFLLTSQMLASLLSLAYLIYLELFVIHFICTLCTVSQVIIGINTILIITWQPWKFNERNLYVSTKRVFKFPLVHPRLKQQLFKFISLSILNFVILTSVAPIGIPTEETTSITAWNMPDFPSQLNSDMCFECNNPVYRDTQGPLSLQGQNPVYSQINEILSDKPVFILFYAEWCGFCKKQKPILMELREEYSDRIEFLYINAPENPQMMQDFGVTGFPTMFYIDKNEEGYIYRVFRGFNEKSVLSDYFDLGYVDVSADKAKQIIDRNKNAIILDVRTPSEYETVRINDSTLIPLAHLESKMDELDKEDFIVVYCKSGGRSQEASNILKEHGFLYVHNMEGGIEAWQEAGFPVVPETEVSVRFSMEAETCNSNIDCNTGEYCAKSAGDCTGTGLCKDKLNSCPEVWIPVCGCDGVTYSNTCEAASAGENVAYEGECGITCASNDDCSIEEFSAGENVIHQECITDADCDSPFVCRNGICSDCVDDTDCDTGFICVSGVCTTYECVDDTDCDAPYICKNDVCITFECADKDCDDGQYCNGAEVCVAGICESGSPVDCNDGISCTVDQCDEITDSCENQPDDTRCDNGQFCDGIETCDALLDCQAGTPLDCSDFDDQCNVGICDEVNDQCVANPDPYEGQPCDDGDPYTIGDTCSAGVCIGESVQCVSDSDCDDGQYCNGAEVCAAGMCEPGSPVDCNDGISCTVDQCDEMTDSCENQPDDTRCDNGQFCDGIETCDILTDCQPGLAPSTDDGVGCTIDSCDETTDTIIHTADDNLCDNGLYCDGIETCDVVLDCQMGTPPCGDLPCDEETDQCGECTEDWQCDNGLFCDGAEICVDYHCMAGTPIDCGDSVSCTIDACNELTDSCDHLPDNSLCDNGQFCDGIETCDILTDCQPGLAPSTDDGVGCTIDSCDETTDTITHTADDNLCDNGLYCDGIETCDAVLDCQVGVFIDCSSFEDQCNIGICDEVSDQCVASPKTDGTSCDDGQFCTINDVCRAGICVFGTPVDCTYLEDECNIGICDEVSDQCVTSPKADGTSCDDGNVCTTGDTCSAGVCTGGTPLDCNDDNVCTDDYCDPSSGCVFINNNAPCDDGLYCTTNDVCMEGICTSGAPRDCTYLEDQCNVGICDEISDQCVTSPKTDGTSCDDGQFCTINDVCMAGICGFGTPVDCTYLEDECNIGICDEVSDQCVASPKADGTLCDDGNVCTTGDTCSAGVCTGGTPLDCNDDNVCTDDYCDPSSGCVFINNNAPCDDGLYCTTNDVCIAGICTSGAPRDCTYLEDQCNVGICDEASNQCVASPKEDGTACNDDLFCTTNDICMAGICGFGTPVDCSYLDDQCNIGICDEVSDQCVADPNPKEGFSCDDGDVCTIGDTCQLGVCTGILDETDSDNDGILDCTDPCPNDPDNDVDNDGICGDMDNCPNFTNPDQTDIDGDGLGDKCDPCPHDPANDADNDGVCGDVDNCPSVSNPDQTDTDSDGIGDKCDPCPHDPTNDADNDGVCGDVDNCPSVSNPDQTDTDSDGIGDKCDPCPHDPTNDADNDGVCGDVDNCPNFTNPDQTDTDGDGLGDKCDPCPHDPANDVDNDGVCGDVDNCPNFTNPDQTDTDSDGVGNVCDNCPSDFNPDQVDTDGDGIGDVCENAPPIADVGGPYSGDEGTIITFNASSSSDPDGDELYYRWDLDNDGVWDTDYSPEPTIIHVWYDDYIGTIVLEVSDGEKTDTVSTTITISNVDPEVYIDLILPEFFALPSDIILFIGSFIDPGTSDTHTIMWDFDDGSIILDNLEQSHMYLEPGIYNVSVTISDDDGGIGTENVIVEVISLQQALESIKEIIASFDTCYKLKKILKIHLELAIKFLNKADKFRTKGKEKLAFIMQWVAKLQLRTFQRIIYVFERKDWITIDMAELLIAMTNRIIPKLGFENRKSQFPHPGPLTTRPGVTFVCSPFFNT